MEDKRKKVSLVLGGGGARGLSHIGVLETLEESGYEIVSVSGTSIGAIIGGVYCAGKLAEYKEWATSLSSFDVVKLMDLSFSYGGIVKGERIMSRVKELVGDVNIEDLNLQYTAVAVELKNRKEFWFKKGSLITAMRASMAIPSIFTPVTIDSKVFVDGGVLNPVPVTPTLSDDSDLTIAVSLNGEHVKESFTDEKKEEEDSIFDSALRYLKIDFSSKKEKEMNYIDITETSLSILQNRVARNNLASTPPDLLLEIPENICGLFDYDKAEELIAYGKERMKQKLKEYISI